jgi:hypothetical protein
VRSAVPNFDFFIGYRRTDAERGLPFVAALRQCGMSVWLDQHAIGEFADHGRPRVCPEGRDGRYASEYHASSAGTTGVSQP